LTVPPLSGISGSYRVRHPSADHREPAMGHIWATSHEL
jgi:hypothetical protein